MIKIIPAIDIIDGKCVRLSQGNYAEKKIYNENPAEVAKMFEDNGLKYLHLVDLDGAKQGKVKNYKVLEQIASKTGLSIDFSGGIKSNEDVEICFNSGAKYIAIGSVAVKNKKLFTDWLQKYGNDKIILSADVKENNIQIAGWLEKSAIELDSFLKDYENEGVKKVYCTDISKDGMLKGLDIDFYARLKLNFPNMEIVASGGVANIKDVIDLQAKNIDGVIIGKAIYENKIKLKELAEIK